MKQRKSKIKSKPVKVNKDLKEVWHKLNSDIEYLQYIITSTESDDIKQDMLFSLFNCLSNTSTSMVKHVWK